MKGTAEEIAKAQRKAVEMKLAGKGWKDIMAATGLTHSQCDLAWYGHQAREDGTFVGSVAWLAMSEAAQYEWIVAARREGVSWGVMAARTEQPESRIRTTFEKHGDLASTGLRVGHGGRFWSAEPRYYQENMKGFGIGHKPGERPNPDAVAAKAKNAKNPLEVKAAAAAKRVRKLANAKATPATEEAVQ